MSRGGGGGGGGGGGLLHVFDTFFTHDAFASLYFEGQTALDCIEFYG